MNETIIPIIIANKDTIKKQVVTKGLFFNIPVLELLLFAFAAILCFVTASSTTVISFKTEISFIVILCFLRNPILKKRPCNKYMTTEKEHRTSPNVENTKLGSGEKQSVALAEPVVVVVLPLEHKVHFALPALSEYELIGQIVHDIERTSSEYSPGGHGVQMSLVSKKEPREQKTVGCNDGCDDGRDDGRDDGCDDGCNDGCVDGWHDGCDVGFDDGCDG